jgi:mono/diheme cytochrome c family protein
MSRALLNLVLFLAFVGTLGLHYAMDRDLKKRNFEAMPEMVHPVSYDTFAKNPIFQDGKTLQLPEPGTIARGELPMHYRPTPEDATRAGLELRNPFSLDNARATERGALIFSNYCKMCHGPEGKGDGPLPQRGIPLPPSLLLERPVQMKDGQLFHILTYGQGNMSSHATQLSRDDRWKVILHIRTLQRQAAGAARP